MNGQVNSSLDLLMTLLMAFSLPLIFLTVVLLVWWKGERDLKAQARRMAELRATESRTEPTDGDPMT
jgi:cell division protein FtsB